MSKIRASPENLSRADEQNRFRKREEWDIEEHFHPILLAFANGQEEGVRWYADVKDV